LTKFQQHFDPNTVISAPEISEDPLQGLESVTSKLVMEFLEGEKRRPGEMSKGSAQRDKPAILKSSPRNGFQSFCVKEL
jgi:hypothetical protein